jgi:DNA-binding response OmpR family regulator
MQGFRGCGPILIAEDNRNIAALLSKYLQRDGFATIIAPDGSEALRRVLTQSPSLVILDLMLPEIDGWEVCRRIRDSSEVPIMMLTALEQEADRIRGFSLGADDYVVKPFSPREVVERVKAILRRGAVRQVPERSTLTCGSISLKPDRYEVRIADQPVSLTASEYSLLFALMKAPGRVFTREELLNRLYLQGPVVGDRVIDVHIGHLRQKIEPDPSRPEYILTKRGIGYHFSDAHGL